MIIVYTAGTFDLLHIGHINLLERAKGLGDRLIVGVSTDELVKEYKGHPPVISFPHRIRAVSALRCVDVAVPQYELDKTPALIKYCADILVVGDDWNTIKGEDYMRETGRKVIFLPRTVGVSSSMFRGVPEAGVPASCEGAEYWQHVSGEGAKAEAAPLATGESS